MILLVLAVVVNDTQVEEDGKAYVKKRCFLFRQFLEKNVSTLVSVFEEAAAGLLTQCGALGSHLLIFMAWRYLSTLRFPLPDTHPFENI